MRAALLVGLCCGALWVSASASSIRRQPTGSIRSKRELASVRVKRQEAGYTYETSYDYEEIPQVYYQDLTGTNYYWWTNTLGKKIKKKIKLGAGFMWWKNASGSWIKKKKVTIKKKKIIKKKKKKIIKKKKKIVTTTTTTPPPPPPKCPDPTPNYEYIPIMEYVSQPRVESVPIYEERIVPNWAFGQSSNWGYARPLSTSILPQTSGVSRRYYMLRRRDGADGLGRMGLGQLQNFLQGQISYRSLNGGAGVPASSWSSGLSRAIRGGGTSLGSPSILSGGGSSLLGSRGIGSSGLMTSSSLGSSGLRGASFGSSLGSSSLGSSLSAAPSLRTGQTFGGRTSFNQFKNKKKH